MGQSAVTPRGAPIQSSSRAFFEIVIPIETVIEKDGDEEKEVESKVFPSYVLIKMIMSDESWHVVRNIRGVTGFVGPDPIPPPSPMRR